MLRAGVVGINHKLADLKLREKLARACNRLFGARNSLHNDHTFVLLSTCNRTEVYFTSEDLSITHTYILNILRNEVSEEFDHKLYSFFGSDCFSHLSRVTAGLDSAIIAETEIQGQVKVAYESTIAYTPIPADLHYLFQKSLKIGKHVRTQLDLGRGMPELEHAVLQIGSQLFKYPKKSKVLFIGTSEINRKILNFFMRKGMENITLCNRSADAANALAESKQLKTLPWDQFSQWQSYDWIIFGTKSPEYLLTRSLLERPVCGQKLVIDLCVPRNVEPGLAKTSGINLFNIDQINRTLKMRKKQMNHSLSEAEFLISEAIHQQITLFSAKEKNRQHYFAIGA